MAFYISEIAGDGSDASGNEFRPALYESGMPVVCCYGGDRVLVEAPDVGSDPRWSLVTDTDLSALGVPTDDVTSDDKLVQRVARTFLLRQKMGETDWGRIPAAVDAIKRGGNGRLAGIDLGEFNPGMTHAEAVKLIVPQFRMKPFASRNRPRPSGTFTDDFNDSDSTNIEDHTPSGGTGWTRVNGSAGNAVISGNVLTTSSTARIGYLCDDQGDADCYVQFDVAGVTVDDDFGGVVRISDQNNFIGARQNAGNLQCLEADAGSFSLLASGNDGGSVTTGDTLKMEASGVSIEGFHDGTSIGSGTSSFNNTVTRQGFVVWSGNGNFIDNFEAGVLAAVPLAVFAHHYRMMRG